MSASNRSQSRLRLQNADTHVGRRGSRARGPSLLRQGRHRGVIVVRMRPLLAALPHTRDGPGGALQRRGWAQAGGRSMRRGHAAAPSDGDEELSPEWGLRGRTRAAPPPGRLPSTRPLAEVRSPAVSLGVVAARRSRVPVRPCVRPPRSRQAATRMLCCARVDPCAVCRLLVARCSSSPRRFYVTAR
jgi:hypothetical protein